MYFSAHSLRTRAFTLIEILVVVTIISILSAILYANFGEAREDAQNRALAASLKEVQLALEVYKAQNGDYPPVPASTCAGGNATVRTAQSTTCGTGYISGLVPQFIAALPMHTESANPSCNIIYSVDGTNRSWYKVSAVNCFAGATSAADGIQQDDEFARCPSTCPATGVCNPASSFFYQSYAVYSRGGECY